MNPYANLLQWNLCPNNGQVETSHFVFYVRLKKRGLLWPQCVLYSEYLLSEALLYVVYIRIMYYEEEYYYEGMVGWNNNVWKIWGVKLAKKDK